jgi:hypothetical protein
MKKLLALMLSVAMVFTIGTSVMAYSDVEEGTYVSEAVTVLSNLDILNGYEDGTFKPEATITRAEMAKIICEALGYYGMDNDKTPFDDVEPKHWAAGYINTAASLGIINGYGNGKFGPEDTVTYEQAVKMVVCALGYEPMAADRGGWPAGYTSVAANIGLTKGLSSSVRGDIAVLIYNALTTPVMEQTSYGSDTRYEVLDGAGNKEYKTILTKRDIYIATGIVGDTFNKDEIKFEVTRDSKDGEFEASEKEITFLMGNSDIANYTHQEVEVYVAEDDGEYTVLAVKAAKKTETFTLVSDDVKDINGNKITYYVDSLNSSRTKTLTIDENATIEYNKVALAANETLETKIEGKDDVEIVFIENDGDSDYDVVVMTEYVSAVVETVNASKDKITLGSRTITFDFDDSNKTYIFLDDEGNELTLADFEEDDVVAYVSDTANPKDADYLKIIKLSNSVIIGTVDSVQNNEQIVTINDEEYKVIDTAIWNQISTPGTEGTFYVGLTGKIVYFDGSAVVGKYGYVIDAGTDGWNDDEIVIKMLTSKGIDRYTLRTSLTDKTGFDIDDYIGKIVEYKINSQGLISSLNVLNTTTFNSKYNADTEILNGKYLDKNTLVFVIDTEDKNESYATDMDYFVDEGTYGGEIYVRYGEVKVVVVTNSNTLYDSDTGFAIVTGTSTLVKNDDTVFAVDYVQDEKKGTIYFEDYTYNEGKDRFPTGTVFVFKADTDGYVKETGYKIVATIANGDFVKADYDEDEPFGKEVTTVFGYIENNTREANSKGELITINGDTYVISTNTNKYTYDSGRSKDKIEIEDFLAGDAYYAETEEDKDGNKTTYVTPVMLKLVDGVVVDIYTISSRIIAN